MSSRLLIDKLDELVAPKRHKKGNINDVLPFAANDSKNMLKGDFKSVVGEFTRQVSNQKIENDQDPLLLKDSAENYGDSIVKKMTTDVTSSNERDKYDLERLLGKMLFDGDQDVQVIHPHIFKYYPLSSGKRSGLEKKISKFLTDVLVQEQAGHFSEVFGKEHGNEDLLISMVLEHLDELKETYFAKRYQNILPEVSKLFVEDFIYISQYRDFFLEHFQTLLQHYYFLYVSQLTFKFEKLEQASYTEISPLYYTLDWESLNKRRSAFDGFYNFKKLRERTSSTFVHIHAQSQLSHNWMNPELNFMTYTELNNKLNEMDDESRNEFITELNDWLKIYSEKMGLEAPEKQSSLHDAYKKLFELLQQGMSTEVCTNYGKLIEDAAYGRFLKTRGSLGYTLNITQDFLLLLTAIAVKDQKRIPLKQLFKEFEKRGVALDRYSRQEVIDQLDSLNIIEKKSDSGDAQYVKAIL